MKSLQVVKVGNPRATDPEVKGRVAVNDIPEPQIVNDEDVKIKVAYCAICGSDPHLIENIFGWQVPFGVGHEISGVIVELGPKATHKGLKVGDRVAGNFLHFCGTCYYCQNGQQQFCENIPEGNSGMSEYVIWHESQVYKLPDSISLREGCLLEPTAVTVRIADKIAPKIGSRIAINGSGPIGLMTLQTLKKYGATNLTIFEPVEQRREIALKLGAEHAINPFETSVYDAMQEITGGYGFDAVIDCSGAVKAVHDLPPIVAKGGTLLYAAQYPNDFEMPLNLSKYLYMNEITVTGFYVSPYCFPRALQLLPELDLSEFTKVSFPLEQGVEAFDAQFSAKYTKILIECNHDIADL